MCKLEIKSTREFLSLGELLSYSSVTNGSVITDQFKWIKASVNGKLIYLANRSLVNKVKFTDVKVETTFLHDNKLYLMRLLTLEEYQTWLLQLVNRCIIGDDFLKTNSTRYIGAGSWLSNGSVFGICGTNSLSMHDRLTISKDIGWRPVVELIEDVKDG